MSEYSNVTTRSNFVGEVVNISYTGGRRQSEIRKELHGEFIEDSEPEVPMSSTPEQIISYFEEVISGTNDTQKKHIYSQAIKMIKELEYRKQKEVADKIKEFSRGKELELEDITVE